MSHNYSIFLDMDGVLCDFHKDFKKISGGIDAVEYESKHKSEGFWNLINSQGAKFWANMSPMNDMLTLKDFVFKNFVGKIYVLSSSSRQKSKSDNADIGKRIWLKSHGFAAGIPASNILIVDSASKKKEYALPDGILVDDYNNNITGWINAGGVGVLHTSTRNTIKELTQYV